MTLHNLQLYFENHMCFALFMNSMRSCKLETTCMLSWSCTEHVPAWCSWANRLFAFMNRLYVCVHEQIGIGMGTGSGKVLHFGQKSLWVPCDLHVYLSHSYFEHSRLDCECACMLLIECAFQFGYIRLHFSHWHCVNSSLVIHQCSYRSFHAFMPVRLFSRLFAILSVFASRLKSCVSIQCDFLSRIPIYSTMERNTAG